MKSTVYISAEQIQVIGYAKKQIKRVVTFPVPEGTMYNGTIMDSAFLSECLALMKKDNPKLFKKGVSLVADGSSILTRRLTTPRLSHKQYLQRVRDDFVDSISDTNDLVCAYRKLGDGAILGCAVNRTQVDSYISTFKAAGIKLTNIHIGAELLHALVRNDRRLQQATVVLNVLDGLMMLSMIFVKGNNILMQRTRLYGDEKAQINNQIIESLNTLNQFAQSQKHDEISQSYYLGMDVADIIELEGLNNHEGIKISPLVLYAGKEDVPPEAHFACLDMQYGQKGMDLIEARRELDRYIRSKRPKKLWIPVLTAYAAVLVGLALYLWLEVRDVESRTAEINAFIQRQDITDAQAELNRLMYETNSVYRISQQFNARAEWEETLALAASHMLDQIIFSHGLDVTISSFNFNEATGVVLVSAITPDAQTSMSYVTALYDMGVARNVVYFGFGPGRDGYAFNVDIYLAIGGDE
jgi:Tfp pilus assembly PilM family ATPase